MAELLSAPGLGAHDYGGFTFPPGFARGGRDTSALRGHGPPSPARMRSATASRTPDSSVCAITPSVNRSARRIAVTSRAASASEAAATASGVLSRGTPGQLRQ